MNGAPLESTLGLPLKQTRLQGSLVKTMVFLPQNLEKNPLRRPAISMCCCQSAGSDKLKSRVTILLILQAVFGGRVCKRSGISVYLTLPIQQATRINVKLLGCHDFKIPNLRDLLWDTLLGGSSQDVRKC